MILFHATRRESLPSILVQGLVPQVGRGMCRTEERSPVIHLTDDPSFVERTMLGTLKREWIWLSVDTRGLMIYPEVYQSPYEGPHLLVAEHCFIVLEPIEAHKIKVAGSQNAAAMGALGDRWDLSC